MIRLKTFLLICIPHLMLGSCAYEQKYWFMKKYHNHPNACGSATILKWLRVNRNN